MSATLRELTRQFVREGMVEAIFLRPARDSPVREVDSAEAIVGRGLVGDRSADRTAIAVGGSKRQVTLIQAEHLPLIAAWSANPTLTAANLRRNLVVSGFNLLAARPLFADETRRVLIGATVEIVLTGDCSPCSKMETALGRGTYNAMRGHGGVTARIVHGGIVKVGDAVRVVTG